jgi:hypothetical protein
MVLYGGEGAAAFNVDNCLVFIRLLIHTEVCVGMQRRKGERAACGCSRPRAPASAAAAAAAAGGGGGGGGGGAAAAAAAAADSEGQEFLQRVTGRNSSTQTQFYCAISVQKLYGNYEMTASAAASMALMMMTLLPGVQRF